MVVGDEIIEEGCVVEKEIENYCQMEYLMIDNQIVCWIYEFLHQEVYFCQLEIKV